jgi:hypothetical protein
MGARQTEGRARAWYHNRYRTLEVRNPKIYDYCKLSIHLFLTCGRSYRLRITPV